MKTKQAGKKKETGEFDIQSDLQDLRVLEGTNISQVVDELYSETEFSSALEEIGTKAKNATTDFILKIVGWLCDKYPAELDERREYKARSAKVPELVSVLFLRFVGVMDGIGGEVKDMLWSKAEHAGNVGVKGIYKDKKSVKIPAHFASVRSEAGYLLKKGVTLDNPAFYDEKTGELVYSKVREVNQKERSKKQGAQAKVAVEETRKGNIEASTGDVMRVINDLRLEAKEKLGEQEAPAFEEWITLKLVTLAKEGRKQLDKLLTPSKPEAKRKPKAQEIVKVAKGKAEPMPEPVAQAVAQ